MAGILIVEDHEDTRDLLRSLLVRWGYETWTAETGEAALALLSQRKPDIVIVDGMMPGMNGIEFIRLLRADEATSNIPAILYTAVADDDFIQNAIAKGANEVWIKGQIQTEQMQERIKTYLQ